MEGVRVSARDEGKGREEWRNREGNWEGGDEGEERGKVYTRMKGKDGNCKEVAKRGGGGGGGLDKGEKG